MSEQTVNLLKENIDHARKSCFNTARKIISRSLRATKVGDATVTQMARDSFHDAVVEVITRAKGGNLDIADATAARKTLNHFTVVQAKREVDRWVRRPTRCALKLDEQETTDRFELRHICGNRYPSPLTALLRKEKRAAANHISNGVLTDSEREILDKWMDSECRLLPVAAELGISRNHVRHVVDKAKRKLTKLIR
jgi:DNA-binding CsgD family transcriptional regulator